MARPLSCRRPYALGRGSPFVPRGRHLAIMTILWDRGSLTAAEIQDALADLEEPEIARQTLATYLATMRRYGWIRAEPVAGRYRYTPTFEIAWARFNTISYIADRLYGGLYEQMLIDVIESTSTPRTALPRVLRALERRLAAPEPRAG